MNPSDLSTVCNSKLGYSGPICLDCDLENGFYRRSDGYYGRCPKPWLAILTAIGYNVGFFLIEIFFVAKMQQKNKKIFENCMLNEEAVPALSSRGYLSVFLLYFQIFAVIRSLSSVVTDLIQTFGPEVNPSQTLLYSLDCVLKYLGVPVKNISYWKIALIGSSPFIKIALLSLFAVLKSRFSQEFSHGPFFTAVVLNIVIFEQPGVL